MQLETNRIILRDIKLEDLKNREKWETIENELQLWDAPWEYEGMMEEEKKEDIKNYLETLSNKAIKLKGAPNNKTRYSFEIVVKDRDRHIGWVSAYYINHNFQWCSRDNESIGIAIGVDIPDKNAIRQGYATEALELFIQYLKGNGIKDIYTQTLSGNLRMIGLAHKLGFEETNRKCHIRMVRNEKYDGLTFKLIE